MITVVHVAIFVLGLGASIIITALFYWIKNLKLKKYHKKLIKEIYSLTPEQRNAYLKNGGNINISDKEVRDNERQSELRRRKLIELRELEERQRGLKKQAYDFGNSDEDSGRFYVPIMDSNSVGERSKDNRRDIEEPTGNNKKIRLSSSEEFGF